MDKHQPERASPPKEPKRFTAEQWVLFIGLFFFLVFVWLVGFFAVVMLSGRPSAITANPIFVEMAATRGFVLPPTWTPSPTRPVIATPLPTGVWDGQAPTRMYTPPPTSLPGLPWPEFGPRLTVLDLARIMQGESPGDKEAAYRVGWVAKNRLLHAGYGNTYAVVSHGFFGYRPDLQPSKEFLDLARRVIRSRDDPTGGCLYALSRTDITKLGVPPSRADVAYGEWFFFRTWPLTYSK